MGRIDNVFGWCLKQGERGEKHKGIRKIKPNSKESKKQIKKSESDLEVMQYLFIGNKSDWVASAAFYAMYHALLAILYKLGYESRNQECTITAIEKLIADKIINLEERYISLIRDIQNIESAKSIREEMQYSSETSMENERCKRLMNQAKEFVDRIKEVLEEIE